MANGANALRRKRLLNGLYTWGIHLLHLVLDLLPAVLRGVLWGPLLGSCGKGLLVDHRVYFKYPWLVEIGDDVSINRGAEFYPGMVHRARIHIGSGVRIAPNVRLHAAGHDPDDPALSDTAAPITVGDGAWLGAASIILPGVTIGAGAIVAAGAVVNSDVAAYSVVGGVPAKFIRMRKGTTS